MSAFCLEKGRKSCPKMIYTVSGGMLNPTHSLPRYYYYYYYIADVLSVTQPLHKCTCFL